MKLVPVGNKGEDHPDYAELVSILFEARTVGHMLHLTTDSYSEHKALDVFYKGVGAFGDSIAEIAFGVLGKPKAFRKSQSFNVPTDIREYLDELRETVQEARDECVHTNLQNELDDVLSLIDQTQYLLTLK